MYTIYYKSNNVAENNEENLLRWRTTLEHIMFCWDMIPEKCYNTQDKMVYYRPELTENGSGKPSMTDFELVFNGKGEDSCETFIYFPFKENRYSCKTARRDYTTAVMIALLCIQKYYDRDMEFHSDEKMDDELLAMCKHIVNVENNEVPYLSDDNTEDKVKEVFFNCFDWMDSNMKDKLYEKLKENIMYEIDSADKEYDESDIKNALTKAISYIVLS